MTKEQEQQCRAILAHFGAGTQKKKCIEECAELIDAILKQESARTTYNDVCSEIADVMIMCRQMAYIYGEREVEDEITRKLERTQ